MTGKREMSTLKPALPAVLKKVAGLRRAPNFGPGVYFLVSNGEVVYVGQSMAPLARIQQHVQEGQKQFDDAYVIDVQVHFLDEVESLYIAMLRPHYNAIDGPCKQNQHSSQQSILLAEIVDGLRDMRRASRRRARAADDDNSVPSLSAHSISGRLIRLPEVMAVVGLRKSSIYAAIRTGVFPAAKRIGHRCVAWDGDEIRAWIDATLRVGAA